MPRLEDLTAKAAVKDGLPDRTVTVVDAKWSGSDVTSSPMVLRPRYFFITLHRQTYRESRY